MLFKEKSPYREYGLTGLFCTWMQAGIFVLALSGCSYFLKDGVEKSDLIRVNSAIQAGDCMSGAVDELMRYLRNEAGYESAEAAIQCAENTIDLFVKNIKGERPGLYSSKELKRFLDQYLVKSSNLTSDFLPTLIRLKASVFGGSVMEISSAEIQDIRVFIGSLRGPLRRLEGDREVLSLSTHIDGRNSEGAARIERAIRNLTSEAKVIGQALAPRKTSPSRNQASFPLEGFATFLNLSEHTAGYSKFLGLSRTLKSLLVRPPGASISSSEWPHVIEQAARGYGLYLRSHFTLSRDSFLFGEQMEAFESTAREGAEILTIAARQHEGGKIGIEEWDALIDELARLKVMHGLQTLPFGIQATSLKAVLRPLFSKVLRPEPTGDLRRLTTSNEKVGLSIGGINRFIAEFEGWAAGQKLAWDLMKGKEERTSLQTILERTNSLRASADASVYQKQAYRQMLQILKFGRVLAWDDEDRLLSVQRASNTVLNRHDLIVLNAIRAGASVVLRSYSHSEDRRRSLSGITESEAQEFYEDVRLIGVDLGIMDPRSRRAGARSFMEGNLFTSVGDGNELLSHHEAVEFFAMILSGGRIAARVGEQAAHECAVGEKDIFGEEKLGANCFRLHLRKNFSKYFSSLPGMAAYVDELARDDDDWEKFIKAIENASRATGFSDHPIETGELRTMMPIIQYAEALLTKFDFDSSGYLKYDELWAGFDVFKSFIVKVSEGRAKSDYMQRLVFSYLVTYNRPPKGSVLDLLKMAPIWTGEPQVWQKASRLDLLEIIASVNLIGVQNKWKSLERFFSQYGAGPLETAFRKGHDAILTEALRLFDCQDEAKNNFFKMAQTRATQIFAPSLGHVMTSEAFMRNVSAEIRRDKYLSKTCIPPM